LVDALIHEVLPDVTGVVENKPIQLSRGDIMAFIFVFLFTLIAVFDRPIPHASKPHAVGQESVREV
jgi:hypothetical protein